MSTLLRNGRLRDGRSVDVTIADGHITDVAEAGSAQPEPGDTVHDLQGWLLLPSMAEPHAHLDKALTAEVVPNPTGDLDGAIESWIANAHQITEDDTHRRARIALDKLVMSGVTAVRTHVNCGEYTGDSSARILAEIREEYRDLVDMQIVALCSSPIMGPEGTGNRAALERTMAAGATHVGGCPAMEDDGQALIDMVIDLANDTGTDIDLHVDETLDPAFLTLRNLARTVMDRGFERSVTASHCVSLGMQPPDVQAEVSAMVAEAGIPIVALPQTNLFLQGHGENTAMPRGLTAVEPLREAGALVTAGGDNVQDPFNLVGRSDPLETAALMVMAAHVLPEDAYDMVSANVRTTMGLSPVSVSVGDPADLLAIDAASTREAMADAPGSRKVFRAGRLVAESLRSGTIHRV